MASRILYSYMRDFRDEDRVVAIGRQLVDGPNGEVLIKFAISVNNPGELRYDYFDGRPIHVGPRDVFNKKRARANIEARLEKPGKHWVVARQAGEHPMDTIRTYIGLNHSEFPRVVVRASSDHTELQEALEAAQAPRAEEGSV